MTGRDPHRGAGSSATRGSRKRLLARVLAGRRLELLGLVFALIVIGWLVWLFGLVLALLCSGLQSNAMLASPESPCKGLWRAVLGGFVFLLITSLVARKYYRRWR
jgi:hypothetical protein